MIEVSGFRRKVLDSVIPEESTNAGLWLDKYLKDNKKDDKKDGKKDLVYEVAEKIKISAAYESFYKKWETSIKTHGVITKEAKTLGRLAVNLGAEAVLENSIALNRTYGVPYIPGSALKGLASHYALNFLKKEEWGKDTKIYKNIFGTQDSAGYVNFYDALIDPKSGMGLVPDVVTVHHQEYYQKEGVPPADWDSPIPIHFLSVSGSFLIALSGPTKNLVDATYKILAYALRDEGIGAKTSSGYGRMEMEGVEIESESKSVVKKKSAQPQEIPAGYQSGVVKNVKESYAFIQPDEGGKDVFVHFSQLAGGLRKLKQSQRVIYKTEPGKKQGELRAVDVRLAE